MCGKIQLYYEMSVAWKLLLMFVYSRNVTE